MGQRRNAAGLALLKRRQQRPKGVAKEQRPPNYQCRWTSAYRSGMSDARSSREDWPTYLRRMTSRPGWSVARLAREAGVNRATIFGWIKGDGVTVASVKLIARALGDDEAHALAAAGGAATHGEQLDPDVLLIARRLANPNVSEAEKTIIRATLQHLAQIAEQAERRGDSGQRNAS